jgi:RNA polymerase sigma-70 factor (ECF subfamily)
MPAALPDYANTLADRIALTDQEIVARVCGGETALFEVLMRRHNQRVYRVARAIVKDEVEAEDVMQQAYINAYTHLRQFESRAQFSTWLTRIVVREALSRRRRAYRGEGEGGMRLTTATPDVDALSAPQADPERQAYARELARVLESAVDRLPEAYRTVFMLRDIEGLSTSETAAGLELGEEAVKTRLHRARAMVRRTIAAHIGAATAEAFSFHAPRCNRVVAAVMSAVAGVAL